MSRNLLLVAAILAPGCLPLSAQTVDCVFAGQHQPRTATRTRSLTTSTLQVSAMRPYTAAASPAAGASYADGSIDAWIFADLNTNKITPAPKTTDWEFIRRATLDLTGRIPLPDRVLAFVADTSADKRSKLIDELLARPEWVDKWTMYLGDLYQNTSLIRSTAVFRTPAGRDIFYRWIQDSLRTGKPYNQMASQLLTSSAELNYQDGPSNWLIGSALLTGPPQDTTDQMAAAAAATFLGIGNMNCVLCHNGRGHLDGVNLWAVRTTRYQAWQFASYFSRTSARSASTSWGLEDNLEGFTSDYTLNTVSGNRPARQPGSGCEPGQPCSQVPPAYIFNGDTPRSGENYRQALARALTGDVQFARAAVNYIWEQFFGRGIVDPPDSFDPARLDPDNPPPAPWTLQPSNARLLNTLAQRFIASGYSLKSLMREIVNSSAYQLSSRYEGEWKLEYEPYFARKFVRRLWAEEIHDAITQSSGIVPNLAADSVTGLKYAMQLPDTLSVPTNDASTSAFLDLFLRGNRDDQARGTTGSVLQALSLMNSPWLENRLQVTGSSPNQLIAKGLQMPDKDAAETLFLSILSRLPSADETDKAVGLLSAKTGADRLSAMQDLTWTLYNKVDFMYNY